MPAAKPTRDELCALLTKLEVDFTAQISDERAAAKLTRAIQRLGVPKTMTVREGQIFESLGFELPSTKAETDEKPKKAATDEKPKTTRKGGGAMAAFKAFFGRRAKVPRDELVTSLTKEAGVDKWSIWNYIALAKKSDKTFGFQLEEKKDKEGVKILHKKSS